MTTDQIRNYIGEDLYNHWTKCASLLQINQAAKTLRTEIQAGILTGIKYHAELKLLNLLIEKAINHPDRLKPRLISAKENEADNYSSREIQAHYEMQYYANLNAETWED